MALCLEAAAAPEPRPGGHTFTDARGGLFRAEVVSVKAGLVELRRGNGPLLSRPLDSFPPSEREYIVGWYLAQLPPGETLAGDAAVIEAAVSIIRDSPRGRNNQRHNTVQPRVRVMSNELTADYTALTGTLLLIGQSATGETLYRVYARETFTFDLPNGARFDFEGKAGPEFVDDSTYAKFGYKYRGYVLVLQNALGDVIYFRSSSSFVKTAAEALQLKAGRAYDRQFNLMQPLKRPG